MEVLLEDKAIIEAQQARRGQTPDRPLLDIHSDAGGLQARRVIKFIAEGGVAPQMDTAS